MFCFTLLRAAWSVTGRRARCVDSSTFRTSDARSAGDCSKTSPSGRMPRSRSLLCTLRWSLGACTLGLRFRLPEPQGVG
eukprot:4580145-Amphidinium_carterae.1